MAQQFSMSQQIAEAILAINPSAVITCGVTTDSIEWLEGTAPISASDIDAKVAELAQAKIDAEAQKATDKANAKAKLIAGEALTEAEADTIVL